MMERMLEYVWFLKLLLLLPVIILLEGLSGFLSIAEGFNRNFLEPFIDMIGEWCGE